MRNLALYSLLKPLEFTSLCISVTRASLQDQSDQLMFFPLVSDLVMYFLKVIDAGSCNFFGTINLCNLQIFYY